MNQAVIEFKARLGAGQRMLGATLAIPHVISAKMLARSGLDYVMIDLEHLPLSPETLALLLDQFRRSSAVPLVRVASLNVDRVKHALDLGARGIVFPSIVSPDQARQAVSFCYYPPRGVRGFGPHWATDFGCTRREYANSAQDAIFVCVMIEHIDAVAQVDAIAEVEGVDGLMIGPSDLSASMGQLLAQVCGDGEAPQIQSAIERTIVAGLRAHKPVFHGASLDPQAVIRQFERGVQAVNIGADYALILGGVRRVLEGIRST